MCSCSSCDKIYNRIMYLLAEGWEKQAGPRMQPRFSSLGEQAPVPLIDAPSLAADSAPHRPHPSSRPSPGLGSLLLPVEPALPPALPPGPKLRNPPATSSLQPGHQPGASSSHCPRLRRPLPAPHLRHVLPGLPLHPLHRDVPLLSSHRGPKQTRENGQT